MFLVALVRLAMDTCSYKHVTPEFNEQNESAQFIWKPFLRQVMVCSVVWSGFFVYGLCIGGQTVFIPQIRKEANSTDAISEEMASWLSAIYGYGGIPWVVILPIAANHFGRKITYVGICITGFVAYIVFYTSKSIVQIIIGEVMESIQGAALLTIGIMVMSEYTSPKYRGIFLTFKSATLFWGIWASNAIGTFFHWKVIGLIKIICSVYPVMAVFLWPESPYWLARMGKLDQCAMSHKWLKGNDEDSEKELKRLLDSYQDLKRTNKPSFFRCKAADAFKFIITKEFYKPTLNSVLVIALYSFSGKMVCAFYSLDIIKKITESEKAAYRIMLILDGFTVLGMYVGCALSKFLKRRTLLLVASIVGVVSLFTLSLYVYLIKLSIVTENQYVSISLLTIYSMGICCGPMIMSTSIYSELLPLSYRSTAVCIVAIVDKILMGTTLKLLPLVVNKFGLHGAFSFFGVSSGICVGLIYKYLPETKDKTLQEIADLMKGSVHKADRGIKINNTDNVDKLLIAA